MMWKRADETDPTHGTIPLDYGWEQTDIGFIPEWYSGRAVPETLTSPAQEDDDDDDEDESASDTAWSEDSSSGS